MPKVKLKRSYNKNDTVIQRLSEGELGIVLNPKNPGLVFRDDEDKLIFIGPCACGDGSGGSGSGGSVDLDGYQKEILEKEINGNQTVVGTLIDLDQRLGKVESTPPVYDKETLKKMGGFGDLAYKDYVTLSDLGPCVKAQLAMAVGAAQASDLCKLQPLSQKTDSIDSDNATSSQNYPTVNAVTTYIKEQLSKYPPGSGSGSGGCDCEVSIWNGAYDMTQVNIPKDCYPYNEETQFQVSLGITGLNITGPTNITSRGTHTFSVVVIPSDATNMNLSWTLDGDMNSGITATSSPTDKKTINLNVPNTFTGSTKCKLTVSDSLSNLTRDITINVTILDGVNDDGGSGSGNGNGSGSGCNCDCECSGD